MWPLKKIADLIDPNWWAEHIGEKSGIFEKARNSKIRAWALGLEGWKWWAWQIIVGGGMLWIFEIILNQIGMTMLPWRQGMKTQSAKAKGRRLQQWVRDQLIEKLEVHPEDIESRSMGAGGEDLIMARAARAKFPYSIECKNVEKLNVWDAYSQAVENSGDYEPLVVMKKNGKKPLVVVDAEYFVRLHNEGTDT